MLENAEPRTIPADGFTAAAGPDSLRDPVDGMCGLGRRAFETTPGGVDLSLGDPVASRPRFGGGRVVPRDIIPNDGAGRAKNCS